MVCCVHTRQWNGICNEVTSFIAPNCREVWTMNCSSSRAFSVADPYSLLFASVGKNYSNGVGVDNFAYEEYPDSRAFSLPSKVCATSCSSTNQMPIRKGNKKKTEEPVLLQQCNCDSQKPRPKEFYDIFLATSVLKSREYKELCRQREKEAKKKKEEDKNLQDNSSMNIESLSDDELSGTIMQLSSCFDKPNGSKETDEYAVAETSDCEESYFNKCKMNNINTSSSSENVSKSSSPEGLDEQDHKPFKLEKTLTGNQNINRFRRDMKWKR